MNHEEDLKIIGEFTGKECERTLACNSLKIRFGEKSSYIWVDPPWELWDSEGLVTSSLTPTTIEAVDKDNFYHHWYASVQNT